MESQYKSICDIRYIKKHESCNCDYMIHDDCLREWLAVKQECVICHRALVYHTSNYEILQLFVCRFIFTVVVCGIVFAMMIGKLVLYSVAVLLVYETVRNNICV
jgi:hypothetical protein